MLMSGLKLRTLLGYYAASSGGSLPTFRDKLSVPSSRVKNPKSIHYHYSLRNYPGDVSVRLRGVESLKSRLGLRFSQWWFCRLKSSGLLHVDWYITNGRSFVVPLSSGPSSPRIAFLDELPNFLRLKFWDDTAVY